MSTGTPGRRVWLAMETDIDTSIIHAAFEREEDAAAYAKLFDGLVDVEEMAVHAAGEAPPVVTVWTAYADVVMKPHGHWPGVGTGARPGAPGTTPCEDRPLTIISRAYQPGREPSSVPWEVLRFEMTTCWRMSIVVRGTDRQAVAERATEMYEGRLRAAERGDPGNDQGETS